MGEQLLQCSANGMCTMLPAHDTTAVVPSSKAA
jgi:hypothetical protein